MSHGGWRTGVVWKVVAGSAALALTSVVLSLVQPVAAGSGWELLAFARIYVTAVVDRQDPNTLHAIIGTDTQMVSNDRGQTWRTVPSDLRPFYVQDPKRPQTYFRCGRAPTPPGITRVERSTDDGQTWSPSWSPTGQVSRCGVTGPGVGVGMPSILFAWALIDAGSGHEASPLMRSM
ncbi:MAG: hypothetical protein Q8P59_03930, partial [Dehalococcoidia bacterium]|nr:hypothetical protein [Dehalococcoidia bacterium]